MSKLRETMANQSLLNNEIAEHEVTHGAPAKKDTTKPFSADIKQLAIELISELPIIPTNDNIMTLLEGLSTSSVGDLPLEDAYKNWGQLVEESKNIFESAKAATTAKNSGLRAKLNIIQ